MAKKKAVWGIDVGQCAIKALRCTLDADGTTIVADRYDYIEYPKILSQPEADPDQLVREALQEFLSRNTVVGDEVAITVPGQAGLSRFFKPPPVDAKTLPDIVKYEVKQQIPFPIEDVIWDWQQLGGTIVDGRTVDAEVGIFAMKRDAVLRAMRPFNEADIDVDLIQLSPLAVFNYVCYDIMDEVPSPEEFDPENPPDSLVVMSMGTETTDLIVTNGIKLWLRNIPIGGNHFTKQLAREMKLTQAKAEHLKRNARQAEDPKSVFKAMRPVFTDLVNEVQRSLTFFQSMEKTANISKIVLLGNAAKLPGLRQFLNKQLELDIAKVSEFEKLKGDEVVNQATFKDNILSFAPSYGLCIQGLGNGVIDTNLLPGEIVKERLIQAKKPWVLASVSLLMLGLLASYYMKDAAWWRVDPRFEVDGTSWQAAQGVVTTQENVSKRFQQQDMELEKKLKNINTLAMELAGASEDKGLWVELQSAIYQALPKDERLDGLESVDPYEIGFNDRKEIYIDHIETAFRKDLYNDWWLSVQPIYLANKSERDNLRRTRAGQPAPDPATEANKPAAPVLPPKPPVPGTTGAAAAAPTPPANPDEEALKQPGWVIEIKGHHLHNSDQAVRNADAARSYLLRTFWTNLNEGTIRLPGNEDEVEGGGEYTFKDFGVYFPTIIRDTDPVETVIVFKQNLIGTGSESGTGGPEGGEAGAGGRGGRESGGDRGRGGGQNNAASSSETTKPGEFRVYRYDFTIQMAWVPRSPRERFQARAERLKREAAENSQNNPSENGGNDTPAENNTPPAKTDD